MPPRRPPCALTRLSVRSQAVLLGAELSAICRHQRRLQGHTGPQVQAHRMALEVRYHAFCSTHMANIQAC